MIKYEVARETGVEVLHPDKVLKNKRLDEFYWEQTSINYEVLRTFDSKEEAMKLFEQEKSKCFTSFCGTFSAGKSLNFDYLMVNEVDYDEETDYSEFIGVVDDYFAPIPQDEE